VQVRLAATTVQNVVTYSVMVQAPNPRQVLLPGMTANVRIVTDRRESVLRVPNDAARFQPAGAGPRAAGGGAPGGGLDGPQGGGGFAGQNAQLAQELGLTKEQQEKLDKGRRELFAQVRAQAPQSGGLAGGGGFPPPPGGGGFPGGGPNDQQGQTMRARLENLMRSVLNDEQMKKWQAQRNARGGAGGVRVRSGTLYTLDGKEPKVHQVRVGLADDRYTELASGDLKEGDAVIVKSHTELKK